MIEPCDIAQLGAGVLRQLAEPIQDVNATDVRELIAAMKATLSASQGVGLAAPQIGYSKRIIIVASRPTTRYPHAPAMSPIIMINPRFSPLSGQQEKDWEGCLSIPGIRALVPRYSSILATYVEEDGNAVEQALHDFVARVFQHEADHLDGMVYLDRVESSQDIVAESEYLKRISR